MVADRIKALRTDRQMTQAELARKLSVTRSSVNAWELGISVPSTQCIVKLAGIFSVSTDYDDEKDCGGEGAPSVE